MFVLHTLALETCIMIFGGLCIGYYNTKVTKAHQIVMEIRYYNHLMFCIYIVTCIFIIFNFIINIIKINNNYTGKYKALHRSIQNLKFPM